MLTLLSLLALVLGFDSGAGFGWRRLLGLVGIVTDWRLVRRVDHAVSQRRLRGNGRIVWIAFQQSVVVQSLRELVFDRCRDRLVSSQSRSGKTTALSS